jgi:putative phage-type endonuclease
MPQPLSKQIIRPWATPGGQLVCSVDVERAVWLAERRKLIGASDVAVLFGQSSYRDEFGLWADKTGRAPDQAANDAMARGQIFEPEIIRLWAERFAGFPIETRRCGLLRSRINPYAGASVDTLSICPQGKCLIEVKTQGDLSQWFGPDGEDEVPTAFQFTGAHQLGVTGRHHIHFLALGPRFKIEHRLMGRDEELIRRIFTVVDDWWAKHVLGDLPPAPSEKSTGLLKLLYTDAQPGEVRELPDELGDKVRRAQKLYAEKAAVEAEYNGLVAELQAVLGNATELTWPDGTPIASWRPSKQIDGANKDWQKAHPEWAEDYSRPKPTLDAAGLKALIEAHPEALTEPGGLRYRRNWQWTTAP